MLLSAGCTMVQVEFMQLIMWAVPAGLETFGVKLPEAAKLFGKKFASGASITKNPMEKDQVEVSQ